MSHLFFANNILLFTKASSSQVILVSDLFALFGRVLGLKISLTKSRAYYSKGVPRGEIDQFTSISSIRSTTSFEKYLGFPIFKGMASKDKFHFIIEKLQSRLASWKHGLLNKAGRLTLTSSILGFVPAYYM